MIVVLVTGLRNLLSVYSEISFTQTNSVLYYYYCIIDCVYLDGYGVEPMALVLICGEMDISRFKVILHHGCTVVYVDMDGVLIRLVMLIINAENFL